MNVARSAAEVAAEHTTLELECIDRMYLNVYVPILQSWAGTAHFFREIRGNPVPSSALMELITRGFVAAIERYAATAGVDLIQFERSERGRPASGAHSALRPHAPMTSKCTAQLLAGLGVTHSLSRPQVSDDNPFSEAQFKTLKYHPGFPGRFHDITAAIAFCRTFFPWYNTEHRHGGIAMLTPDDVHHHRTQSVLDQRGRTLQAAWTRHPERFVRGIPKPDLLPEAVWINPPVTSTTGDTAQ